MTTGGVPVPGRTARPPDTHRQESTNLADILERVLDKGIVIAGDIRVNLLDIELLTIKIRLLVASVDKAREMGIDWWEHDTSLSSGKNGTDITALVEENRVLRERIEALEERPAGELEDAGDAEEDADEDGEEQVPEEDVEPEPVAARRTARRGEGRRR